MTTAAVLASRIRTEEKEILAALARRGVRAVHVPTTQWHASLVDGRAPWPLAVNRELSWTRARYLARTLEEAGTTVLNSAAATETCGDKWLSALALRRAGLPVPRTALALEPEAGMAAADLLGYPVVIKPVVSSWGRRVSLVRDRDAAAAVFEHCAALPSPQARVTCVQEYLDSPRDIRVVVVDRRPVGAMFRRRNGDWRTNVARGGAIEPCVVDEQLAKLAVTAADAVGADIAGVDLVETADSVLVLEVNHNVEFAGLRRAVPGADIADSIAGLVLATISGTGRSARIGVWP